MLQMVVISCATVQRPAVYTSVTAATTQHWTHLRASNQVLIDYHNSCSVDQIFYGHHYQPPCQMENCRYIHFKKNLGPYCN